MDATAKSRLVRQALAQAGLTAVTVALLAAAAIWLPAPIVNRMLEHDILARAEVWQSQIVRHLEAQERTFLTGTVTAEDEEFLERIGLTSEIYRISLVGAAGSTFYSSRPGETGERHEADGHEEIGHDHGILPDETEVVFLTLPAEEVDNLALHVAANDTGQSRLVGEIEIPVWLGGQPVGIVEMFTDLTAMHAAFVGRVQALIASVAVVALMIGGSVMVAFVRANRQRIAAMRIRATEEHNSLSDQLRMAREVRLLGELNEWLQSSRSLDELFDMVARFLTHILPDCEGSIYVYSNSRDVLDGCASWNGGHHKAHIHPEECWGLRRGRSYVFGDSDIDFTCGHAEPHDGRSYLCIPVLAHGETVGLMHLRAREGKSVQDFREGRRLAQMCAEQISLAIANVRMRDQLQDQSIRDPLTGLFNRRHLTDTLRRALSARQRSGADLAVVAIDIDHFKRFNDNHGHDAGDMVLRAVGAALAQLCDRDELACRIGGEELMVLLPATDAAAAMTRAEAMRAAVEAVTVRYGEKTLPRITISLGVAVAPQHGVLPQDLMRAADDALYEAKGQGRNQTVLADFSKQAESEAVPLPRIAAE